MAAYLLLLIVLVATSPARRVGDAPEYLAMADNLRSLDPPALSIADIQRAEGHFSRWRSGYQGARLRKPALRHGLGRQDFAHFWFYPALAAAPLAATEASGANPTHAFTFVNAVLLLLAAGVLARRVGLAGATLLLVGPIVWWVDKIHTEVFTFSLLAIAFAYLDEHPERSFVALGIGATQNPPIALLIPLAVAVAVLSDRRRLRRRRFWAALVLAGAFAALHPVYYLYRLGVATPLQGINVEFGIPTFADLSTPVFDLNLGLLPNFPVTGVLVLGLLIALAARAPRRLAAPTVLAAPIAAVVLLFSFAQGININHGGTPGVSRYAIWLIPLTLPLLIAVRTSFGNAADRWLGGLAVVAAVWTVVAFHPARDETRHHPTWLAEQAWNHQPGLYEPVAEIFFERVAHREGPIRPVTTASCNKALLVGGMWPAGCVQVTPPANCRGRESLCYANRDGARYDFTVPPRGS